LIPCDIVALPWYARGRRAPSIPSERKSDHPERRRCQTTALGIMYSRTLSSRVKGCPASKQKARCSCLWPGPVVVQGARTGALTSLVLPNRGGNGAAPFVSGPSHRCLEQHQRQWKTSFLTYADSSGRGNVQYDLDQQWPRRKNMAKAHDIDLPDAEMPRTWIGLPVREHKIGCFDLASAIRW
jgi:hypothetical protein